MLRYSVVWKLKCLCLVHHGYFSSFRTTSTSRMDGTVTAKLHARIQEGRGKQHDAESSIAVAKQRYPAKIPAL